MIMETVGEALLDIVNPLLGSKIVVAKVDRLDENNTMEQALAITRLGLALRKRPVLQLRSIVEDWDAARIVRELY